MKSIRALIESIDKINENNNNDVIKTKWHLSVHHYIAPYNYISSWLDEFDSLKEKNQKLNIEAFKNNFKKLIKELDRIPRYKEFTKNPSKKFFRSERNAFTSILYSVKTIETKFNFYLQELRREGTRAWEKYNEEIIKELENIQIQIDTLEKQGSLVSRIIRHTDNFGKDIKPFDPLV